MSPLYDFYCNKCKRTVELKSVHNRTEYCRKCGQKMTRYISAGHPPIIKGTKTPYKGK